MSQIPQDTIDRIQGAADIVKVIGKDVALKKQGVNYVGLCPFHNEKTPSFTVSPARGIYKCFSCGEGGNVISYLQKANGMSFPEAVRELGKQYGIDVPNVELTNEQRISQQEKESARIAIEEAHNLFCWNLKRSPEGNEYLSDRNIKPAIVEQFGLGFAFSSNELSKRMVQKGYNPKHLITCGVSYMDDQHTLHDFFYNRIIFPFYDHLGNVIGFDGRDIRPIPADKSKPYIKYKNTGDTILFKKGSCLYGLYQARKSIIQKDKVYIVEGQMDVLQSFQSGLTNVVASSGCAFDERQRRLIHNITSNVVLLLDGDDAGIKSAIDKIPKFVKDEFVVKCVLLPVGKDPDDMAKIKGMDFPKWVEEKETSYIDFLGHTLFDPADDEYRKLAKTKTVLAIIMTEKEAIIREKLMGELYSFTGYSLEQLNQLTGSIQTPEEPEHFQPGFYGTEFIKEYIEKEEKIIHLTPDFHRFQTNIGEKQPWLFYYGLPSQGEIQNLMQLADRVIVHSPDMQCDGRSENSDCKLMKEMFKFGLTVDVMDNSEVPVGFLFFYISWYGDRIRKDSPTPEVKNEYITRCAEMISYARESIQTINMEAWAKILDLKTTALKDVLKPFNSERKSRRKIERERGDIFNDLMYVDESNIPDYVLQNEEYKKMLDRFNFYPLLNNDGIPVSYMFKTDNTSYHRVSDFYMEPLFHVYSTNDEENRRILRLNSLYDKKPKYVEWPSTTFVKLTEIQKKLVCLDGGYNFENGTAVDYNRIWTYMSHKFPACTQIKVYGQQEEGCFLFSNAILHQVDNEWQFEFCDDLGLMRDGDTLFYSPAFSKINLGRKDNDQFEQERFLAYTDTPAKKRTTFEHWASLMNEVYQINDNGKWAIIFAIMCAFRSDIHPLMNRTFTSLFFVGPTESGKTQIAVSIRSLFIRPEAPAFNLTSGTDAAFFSILEKFRDVPQIYEEYNDEMISDAKFQGLKDVTYDSNGKQKRKSATTNDIETSKVNAPVIILGQEVPQKDDNALTNRVILCEVPKSPKLREEHAVEIFQELKDYERAGLSYLLVDILKLRPLIREHFSEVWKRTSRELQQRLESITGSKSGDQARITNTVSMFVTTLKIVENYAPHIKLPFTVEEFIPIAVEKIRSQVDMIIKTDKLATFFNTIDYLLDKGTVKYGRDYKIVRPGRNIKLKDSQEYVLPSTDTSIIYMRLSTLHSIYSSAIGTKEAFTLGTIQQNLRSSPAYIGMVDSTKFHYMEAKEVPASQAYQNDNATPGAKPNMTLTRIMVPVERSYSAMVLNYDVLKGLIGINLDRENEGGNNTLVEKEPPLPF